MASNVQKTFETTQDSSLLQEPAIYRFADLFCGLGAFHRAFARSKRRYRCVFASDIDPGIRKVYQENYGVSVHGDINKVSIDDMPNFEILCAGFPCQPFSIAGKKLGFDDQNKGNLFYRLLEIIDAKSPRLLLLENVKNLKTIHGGDTFRTIERELQRRGYYVANRIIDSKYHGVPQSRKRIYIVCCKLPTKFHFPDENQTTVVPVSRILDTSITEYFDYDKRYRLEPCAAVKRENGTKKQNKAKKPTRPIMRYRLFNRATGKGGRQGERVYSIDSCGPTVCAQSGGPGAKTGLYEVLPKKIRTLTVPEVLGMFGYDADYCYTTLKNPRRMLFYLGNSIVVNVLQYIIGAIEEQGLLE